MMVGKITVKDEEGKEVEKDVWEVLVLGPESDAYNVTGGDIRDARAAIRPGNGHARSRCSPSTRRAGRSSAA